MKAQKSIGVDSCKTQFDIKIHNGIQIKKSKRTLEKSLVLLKLRPQNEELFKCQLKQS